MNGSVSVSVQDFPESSDTLPETRLMQATILNAINDACGRSADFHGRQKSRREALRWLREGGSDFQAVCHLANFDPLTVRQAALAFIEAYDGKSSIMRYQYREPE